MIHDVGGNYVSPVSAETTEGLFLELDLAGGFPSPGIVKLALSGRVSITLPVLPSRTGRTSGWPILLDPCSATAAVLEYWAMGSLLGGDYVLIGTLGKRKKWPLEKHLLHARQGETRTNKARPPYPRHSAGSEEFV